MSEKDVKQQQLARALQQQIEEKKLLKKKEKEDLWREEHAEFAFMPDQGPHATVSENLAAGNNLAKLVSWEDSGVRP